MCVRVCGCVCGQYVEYVSVSHHNILHFYEVRVDAEGQRNKNLILWVIKVQKNRAKRKGKVGAKQKSWLTFAAVAICSEYF